MSLKFRAWDKDTKQMCDVLELDFFEKHKVFVSVFEGEHMEIVDLVVGEQAEVMQCIGHQDKNKKDIYAGDIVKLVCLDPYSDNHDVDYENWPKIEAIGIVTEGYNGWRAEQVSPKDDPAHCQNCFYDPEGMDFSWEELEVTGNIYEDI